MKHTTHFAPPRERRYPVLTAIDLTLFWALNLTAIALSAIALKMAFALMVQHPNVQLVLSRLI